MNDLIKDIDLLNESWNRTELITLDKRIFNNIKNYIKIKEINNRLTNFINKELENIENKRLLPYMELYTKYNEETGLKSNKTTIN